MNTLEELSRIFAGALFVVLISAAFLLFLSPLSNATYVYALVGCTFSAYAALLLVSRFIKTFAYSIGTFISILCCSLLFQLFVPMTIERSITVFLFEKMNETPGVAFSRADLESMLFSDYVQERDAIGKRLNENLVNGLIEESGRKFKLSSKGRMVTYSLYVTGRFFSVPRLKK